jgi:hypothetical protein
MLLQGKLMTGDPVNQLAGPDKTVLNLSEWDGKTAYEYLRRPSSVGYRFFLISDSTSAENESLLEKYEKVSRAMDMNADAPGLEMLLSTYFSAKNVERWNREIFNSPDAVKIPAGHPCFTSDPVMPKSYVIYAVDMTEISKRAADAKANPLKNILGNLAAAAVKSNTLAIEGAPQKMLEDTSNAQTSAGNQQAQMPLRSPEVTSPEISSSKRKRDEEDGETDDDDDVVLKYNRND